MIKASLLVVALTGVAPLTFIAADWWDQRSFSVQTPTTGEEHWTATTRPMGQDSQQTILNSDRGRYLLCTTRGTTVQCDGP